MITLRSPSDIPLTCHFLYLGRATTMNPTQHMFGVFCRVGWGGGGEAVVHFVELRAVRHSSFCGIVYQNVQDPSILHGLLF